MLPSFIPTKVSPQPNLPFCTHPSESPFLNHPSHRPGTEYPPLCTCCCVGVVGTGSVLCCRGATAAGHMKKNLTLVCEYDAPLPCCGTFFTQMSPPGDRGERTGIGCAFPQKPKPRNHSRHLSFPVPLKWAGILGPLGGHFNNVRQSAWSCGARKKSPSTLATPSSPAPSPTESLLQTVQKHSLRRHTGGVKELRFTRVST